MSPIGNLFRHDFAIDMRYQARMWMLTALFVAMASDASAAAKGISATDPGLQEIKPEAIAAVQAECRERPYSMLLTIRNIKDAKGIITIDVHPDDPAIWLKKGSKIGRYRALPEKGQIELCIPVDKPGSYGLAIYQDKDINFNLNKNFLGLPSEPYAVSNDPAMNFSLPDIEDSLTVVNGPLTPVRATLHN
jgi:uncharacterized protein (DUF2141 family)